MAEKREKRRIKRPRPEKQPIPRGCPPRWAWFFGGLLIGVFGAFLFYLYELAPSQLQAPANLTQEELSASPALNYEDYEFYNNLSQNEVKVVETVDHDKKLIENQVINLQVGSFRDAKTAQGLKNHLANLSIQADIEQATINGLSWHRVRVGPFNSEQSLEEMKKKLTQHKIPFSIVE